MRPSPRLGLSARPRAFSLASCGPQARRKGLVGRPFRLRAIGTPPQTLGKHPGHGIYCAQALIGREQQQLCAPVENVLYRESHLMVDRIADLGKEQCRSRGNRLAQLRTARYRIQDCLALRAVPCNQASDGRPWYAGVSFAQPVLESFQPIARTVAARKWQPVGPARAYSAVHLVHVIERLDGEVDDALGHAAVRG